MKKIIINQEIIVLDSNLDTYKSLLNFLKIPYNLQSYKKDPIPVSMYEISCKTIGRTSNILKSWIDINMSADEFVKKYSRYDFLKQKHSGQKSLLSLCIVLKQYGYNW